MAMYVPVRPAPPLKYDWKKRQKRKNLHAHTFRPIQLIQLRLSFQKRNLCTMSAQVMLDYGLFRSQILRKLSFWKVNLPS